MNGLLWPFIFIFNKLQPGDSVRVRYLPDKPETCKLEV